MKTLYSTKATVTGGRTGNASLNDSDLKINMAPPGGNMEGNNPEQLLAMGYAACFDSALGVVKKMEKASFGSTTETTVDLKQGDNHDYKLAVKIHVIADSTDISADDFQKLVEKAQKGDKKAFGILVEKYNKKLTRLLSRMVRDQSEIEDIVQDSFIKAYRAINNFRGDSAFYTWLYRIGINTAKNHLVSLGRRPKAMNTVEMEDVENFDDGHEMRNLETPETSMMTDEIVVTVNQSIELLPDDLRQAISLREMDGLSYEEIADIMNCPIGTVRSRIFRAREAISEKLKPLLEKTNKRW